MLRRNNQGDRLLSRLSNYFVLGKNPAADYETGMSILNYSDREINIKTNGISRDIYPFTIYEFERLQPDDTLILEAKGKKYYFKRSDFKRKLNAYYEEVDPDFTYFKHRWLKSALNSSDIIKVSGTKAKLEYKKDLEIIHDRTINYLLIALVIAVVILFILFALNFKINNGILQLSQVSVAGE